MLKLYLPYQGRKKATTLSEGDTLALEHPQDSPAWLVSFFGERNGRSANFLVKPGGDNKLLLRALSHPRAVREVLALLAEHGLSMKVIHGMSTNTTMYFRVQRTR